MSCDVRGSNLLWTSICFRNEACDGEVSEALCVEVDEGNEAIEGFEVF